MENKTKKHSAVITDINYIRYNSTMNETDVYVSLSGMRADLTDCLKIRTSDIKQWYGVDKNGYSIQYELRVGTTIYFDSIFVKTREIENPSFF
jgi:hypothetical protein